MSTRRRTVPRSAPRGQRASTDTRTDEAGAAAAAAAAAAEDYAPQFCARVTPAGGPADAVAEIARRAGRRRAGGEGSLRATVTYCDYPLQKARWAPVRAGGEVGPGEDRPAVLAIGSGDGGAQRGSVRLYSVKRGEERRRYRGTDGEGEDEAAPMGLLCTEAGRAEHGGKVTGMEVWGNKGRLVVCSSDGGIGLVDCERVLEEKSGSEVEIVGKIAKGRRGREGAVGVVGLGRSHIIGAGSEGSLICVDSGMKKAVYELRTMDAIGFKGVTVIDPEGGTEYITAGASGVVTVWDSREVAQSLKCAQALKYTVPGMKPMCLAVDAARPQYVLAGSADGQIAIWDRRGGDGFPLSLLAVHDSIVWEIHVASASRPGVLVTCGEDAGVWLLDFASAASRGGVKSSSKAMGNSDSDIWRARLIESDARDLSVESGPTIGVNSVDFHPESELIAYVSDSGTITVTA